MNGFMHELTWRDIFADFKCRHPNLSKTAAGFRPYDFATIMVYLRDGSSMIYNYDKKRAAFLNSVRIADSANAVMRR